MKIKIYYEKEDDKMIVDVVNSFISNSEDPLYRLKFKQIETKVHLGTAYYSEGHPRVAQIGTCNKIIINDENSLTIV